MNVAIVSEGPCYPPNAGNRIRTLNLMLPLARRHQLTFLCRSHGDRAEASQMEAFLSDHGIRSIIVEDPPSPKKGPLFYLRLAGNLLSSVPYSVTLHNSPLLRERMRQHAREHQVDVWQLEWLPYATALRGLPGVRTVVVAHDVVSLLWKRHHDIEKSPLKRWYIRQQWRKFARFEKAVFDEATRVVAVSPEDAVLIQQRYGVNDKVDVVENGVDNASFAAVEGTRDPNAILYMGTLESRPNLDAVRLLLEDIFPAVRARQPAARLVIVGRRPPEWLVKQATQVAGVELHGDVPDVRPFLARSGLLAVPLRIAGGSRIKILEALSAGLPVVSTTVGAEGLSLTAGKDLVVVERVEDMAEALCQALAAPAILQETARQGREVVRQRYDWSALGDKLEHVWQKCHAEK